ncbi:MAG: hypothetical protein KGY80_05835 [Candidatus Thorarchaeota archaeon]|nr:hypothetical protein [Candidatus Thorarchaeota archaeon]
MEAWIKIFVVLILFSALSVVINYMFYDPFLGLILLGVLLTLLILSLEPATGKAMAQVVVPLTIILFVFQVLLNPAYDFSLWTLIVIGAIMYLMFAMFTGGGGFIEGGFIDAKVTLKLFPIFGVAIFLSMLADPSYRTTVYIMAGTILGLMALYFVFLRGYEDWPEVEYTGPKIATAITDIDPEGKVKSGAEIWWAKTRGPAIEEGEEVVVRGVMGLTMIVSKAEDVSRPAPEPIE